MCKWEDTGVHCDGLLDRFINHFSPFILNHSTFLSLSKAKSLCSTFLVSPDMRGVGGLPGMAETLPRKGGPMQDPSNQGGQ